MKKFITCAAALIMVFGTAAAIPKSKSVLEFSVSAYEQFYDDTLISGAYEYKLLDDGTAEIVYYHGEDSEVTVPSTLDGKTVTSINYGFNYRENLTKLVIPSTVKTIMKDAVDFTKTSVTISSDNPYLIIENNTLYSKDKTTLYYILEPRTVESYIIPDTVKTIGEAAFYYCDKMTSVTIPDSVTTIGGSAFSQCESLTSVVVPDSATTLGGFIFHNCYSLVSVKMPKSVVSADTTGWFYDCEELTSVNLPDNIKKIGDVAFLACRKLSSLTIPNSVTEIGEETFEGCGFKSIVIPEGVTKIDSGAFMGCTKLTSITLPDTLKQVGVQTFNGLTSLKTITIPKNTKVYCDEAGGQLELYNVFYGSDKLVVNCYSGSPMEKYLKACVAKNHQLWNVNYKVIDIAFKNCPATLSATSYTYNGSAKKPTVTVKNGTTTLKSGTDYTVAYKSNTNIGTATVTITGKGSYTGTITKTFKIIPANVTGFKASSTSASAVKLSWTKVSGAGGYYIYQYNTSTGKWKRIARTTTTTNSYTVKSLKAGTTYKFAVKAYKEVSGTDYASAKFPSLSTSTNPAKVSFTAKSSAAKKIAYSWTKVTGATSYNVYYRVKGTSKWSKVTVASSAKSKTISGLKSGKTYEVTVKAVRKTGGVNYNGAYTVKTVKVK